MNKQTDALRAVARGAGALGVLLLAGAGTLDAQQPEPGAALQAWVGCWSPAGAAEGAETAGEPPVVCILPAAGGAVEVVSLAGDAVVERERVSLDTPRATGGQGCSGIETVTPSADGRRVYRRGEESCAGDLRRTSTSLMAMLPRGEWLDVQSVTAGGYTDVRVVRYRAADAPAPVAAALAAARERSGRSIDAARVAAAAPVDLAQVVEASRQVDPEVVEAWLVERGQPFAIDARRLLALSEAGVPGRVTDLVVALSYPQRFAINRGTREAAMRPDETGRAAEPRVFRPGYGRGPMLYPGYGWGYGSGFGYGYRPGYYGYGYSGYPPVIVVRGPNDGEAEGTGGRAVPGRGYTRSRDGSAAPARPSPNADRSGSASSAPRPAATSSGSGESRPTRTAKPRPRDN